MWFLTKYALSKKCVEMNLFFSFKCVKIIYAYLNFWRSKTLSFRITRIYMKDVEERSGIKVSQKMWMEVWIK